MATAGHFELPDPPERQYDERTSNFDHLTITGSAYHVVQFLGNRETTLVTADRYITMMPERQLPSGQTRRVPDLLIASTLTRSCTRPTTATSCSYRGSPRTSCWRSRR